MPQPTIRGTNWAPAPRPSPARACGRQLHPPPPAYRPSPSASAASWGNAAPGAHGKRSVTSAVLACAAQRTHNPRHCAGLHNPMRAQRSQHRRRRFHKPRLAKRRMAPCGEEGHRRDPGRDRAAVVGATRPAQGTRHRARHPHLHPHHTHTHRHTHPHTAPEEAVCFLASYEARRWS